MAHSRHLLEQEQFNCPICLDLLKDPVAIPCGHSYCMGCINGCWDLEDQVGVYNCPQCRETFGSRPNLKKNTLLAEVVEKLKKAGLQTASDAHCYAGPEDVACDVCTERKCKAVKSCLVCLASYCETHLQPHYDSAAFKKHKLTDITGNLQDKICSNHDKLLEIYCRTDQQCVCYLCTLDEHRGHDVVSAVAERTEREIKVQERQIEFQQLIHKTEKRLQDVRSALHSLTLSAQSAVEDSERIFTELIQSIERTRSEVLKQIRDQEKAALTEAEELMTKLEEEITELKSREAKVEQLSQTEDHIYFLQMFQSVPPGPEDSPSFIINPQCSFSGVTEAVCSLRKETVTVCNKKLLTLVQKVKNVNIHQFPHTSAKHALRVSGSILTRNTTRRLLGKSKTVIRGPPSSVPQPAQPTAISPEFPDWSLCHRRMIKLLPDEQQDIWE